MKLEDLYSTLVLMCFIIENQRMFTLIFDTVPSEHHRLWLICLYVLIGDVLFVRLNRYWTPPIKTYLHVWLGFQMLIKYFTQIYVIITPFTLKIGASEILQCASDFTSANAPIQSSYFVYKFKLRVLCARWLKTTTRDFHKQILHMHNT